MTGDTLVTDMPARFKFRTLQDRLVAMSDPICMVGEFEISKTAEVIRRTVKVMNKSTGNIVTYGDNFTDQPPFLFCTLRLLPLLVIMRHLYEKNLLYSVS